MPGLHELPPKENRLVEKVFLAGVITSDGTIISEHPNSTEGSAKAAESMAIAAAGIYGAWVLTAGATAACFVSALPAAAAAYIGVSAASAGSVALSGAATAPAVVALPAVLGAAAVGMSIGGLRTIQVVLNNNSRRTFRVADTFRDIGNLTYPVEIPPRSVVSLVLHHQGPGVGSYIVYEEVGSPAGQGWNIMIGASNPFIGKNKLIVKVDKQRMSAKQVDKASTRWSIIEGPVNVLEERYDNPSYAWLNLFSEERAAEEARHKLLEEQRKEHEQLTRDYPMPQWQKDASFGDNSINVGITGSSGTGKSTLIAEVLYPDELKDKVVTSNQGDGTTSPTPHQVQTLPNSKRLVITDLPGAATEKIPAKSYLKDYGIKYFDLMVVAVGQRIQEADIALIEALKDAKVPYVVVRTKVDIDIQEDLRKTSQPSWSADEAHSHVQSLLSSIKAACAADAHCDVGGVYLTSSWEQGSFEFHKAIRECNLALKDHIKTMVDSANNGQRRWYEAPEAAPGA